MKEEADLTGRRFGKWTVIKKTANKKWLCRCKCGTKRVKSEFDLERGRSTQCQQCASRQDLKDGTKLSNLTAKKRKDNTSGAKGVTYNANNGRYYPFIKLRKKRYSLGGYATLEEAVAVRKEAEVKFYHPILEKYNKL